MIKTSLQLIVVLFALGSLFSMNVSAKEFHGHMSGTQFSTAFDSNGDGQVANDTQGTGRFTQIGRFTLKGANETLPWDGSSFCSATKIRLEQFYFHMVFTVENGDMLFTEQTAGDVCWDFLDFTWWANHEVQIVGGTGRFTHATGYFNCYNVGSTLLNPLNAVVGNTWEAECQGELENADLGD